MIIRTLYNIGEVVWFIRNNKVCNAPIVKIHYSTDGKFYSLSYQLEGYCESLHPHNFQENELFKSKEELIKSL